MEAATDTTSAWYRDCDGSENADMCSYDYGRVSFNGNIHYNVQLGTHYFLVQQIWVVGTSGSSSACALGVNAPYVKPTDVTTNYAQAVVIVGSVAGAVGAVMLAGIACYCWRGKTYDSVIADT
jgi:hypothetical protein